MTNKREAVRDPSCRSCCSLRQDDKHSAVAEGFGIGFIPCYLADEDPRLVRIWPDVAPHMQKLWLIHHEDLRRTARIKLVSDAIAAALRRESRVLRGECKKQTLKPRLA